MGWGRVARLVMGPGSEWFGETSWKQSSGWSRNVGDGEDKAHLGWWVCAGKQREEPHPGCTAGCDVDEPQVPPGVVSRSWYL